MKIVTIVGARPQFIKAAAVSRAIREHNGSTSDGRSRITEVLVHTGQHYDQNMSDVFFKQLEIPEPKVNLGVGSGPHGRQTAEMLTRIEQVLETEAPDWVLVYGDTNSTLAGALAAVKMHIPVAHVEAGLRSFNRRMPEEINRLLTDHVSSLLFCPSQKAVSNLHEEGIGDKGEMDERLSCNSKAPTEYPQGPHKILLVGDVMFDSVLFYSKLAEKKSGIFEMLDLKPKHYALATVHRAENTDDPENLKSIFTAFQKLVQNGLKIVVPIHPRTRKKLDHLGMALEDVQSIAPVSYLDMLLLEKHAKIILTDSGGIQKEAFWFKVPCVTLRHETEWVETVSAGYNVLTGPECSRIMQAAEGVRNILPTPEPFYGDGTAANKIVDILQALSGS